MNPPQLADASGSNKRSASDDAIASALRHAKVARSSRADLAEAEKAETEAALRVFELRQRVVVLDRNANDAIRAVGLTMWVIKTPSKTPLCIASEARARAVWAQMVAAATDGETDGAALLESTGFKPPQQYPMSIEYDLTPDGKLESALGSEDALVERWVRAARIHYALEVQSKERDRGRFETVTRHGVFTTNEARSACRERVLALCAGDPDIKTEVYPTLLWTTNWAKEPRRSDAEIADALLERLAACVSKTQ